jgi:hypothetical protein
LPMATRPLPIAHRPSPIRQVPLGRSLISIDVR